MKFNFLLSIVNFGSISNQEIHIEDYIKIGMSNTTRFIVIFLSLKVINILSLVILFPLGNSMHILLIDVGSNPNFSIIPRGIKL